MYLYLFIFLLTLKGRCGVNFDPKFFLHKMIDQGELFNQF